MQYGLAATLIQAVDDFLDGPDMLRDGSAAAATAIRRIRAEYPETQMLPVPPWRATSARCRSSGPERAGARGTDLAQAAAYLLTDRVVHPTGMVVAGDAHWWHVSTFGRAVVTDMPSRPCGCAPGPGAGDGARQARRSVAGPAGGGGPEGRGAVPAEMGS